MKLNAKNVIEKAVEIAGGWQKFSDLVGVSYAATWKWRQGRSVPGGAIVCAALQIIARERPHLVLKAVERARDNKDKEKLAS